MDWKTRLSHYSGYQMEIVIEDTAGTDPLAPPMTRTLHKVRLSEEKTHLKFYFNATQFLAIPVYEDDRTSIDTIGEEAAFVSHDGDAKLIYKLHFRKS